jgi:peptide/nickel transport system permease protein
LSKTPRRGTVELVIGIAILIAIFVAPLLAPQSPLTNTVEILHAPSGTHILGTDRFGRDVFSRFLDGGRLIAMLSILAGILAAALGAVIGMVSGYLRGTTDAVLMRLVDVMLALPPILVILVVAAALPKSNVVLVVLVGVLLTPGAARILRGLTQQYAAREFVAAAEAAGSRWYDVLIHEIMPNVRIRLLLEVALRTGFAVILISSLNFLGLGVSPPTPDWGLEINEGRDVITLAPWTVVAPAIGLAMLVAAVNLVADGIGQLVA